MALEQLDAPVTALGGLLEEFRQGGIVTRSAEQEGMERPHPESRAEDVVFHEAIVRREVRASPQAVEPIPAWVDIRADDAGLRQRRP